MGPLPAPTADLRVRLPRVSGDGPEVLAAAKKQQEAAPRERGWALVNAVVQNSGAGCPA